PFVPVFVNTDDAAERGAALVGDVNRLHAPDSPFSSTAPAAASAAPRSEGRKQVVTPTRPASAKNGLAKATTKKSNLAPILVGLGFALAVVLVLLSGKGTPDSTGQQPSAAVASGDTPAT